MTFAFTEQPTPRLEQRLDQLMDLDETIQHGRSRQHELCREIAHLCFELEFRPASDYNPQLIV